MSWSVLPSRSWRDVTMMFGTRRTVSLGVTFLTRVVSMSKTLLDVAGEKGISEFVALAADQPICFPAFVLLLHSDPEILARDLLASIPNSTKTVLGKAGLMAVDDLLSLPLVAPDLKDGGCYLAIGPTREGRTTVGGTATPDYPTTTLNGRRCEAGVYPGATMNPNGGFSARMKEHRGLMKQKRLGKINKYNSTRHYRFTGRIGV
jgi:hypothetical protein